MEEKKPIEQTQTVEKCGSCRNGLLLIPGSIYCSVHGARCSENFTCGYFDRRSGQKETKMEDIENCGTCKEADIPEFFLHEEDNGEEET